MKKVNQSIKHDPNSDIPGDCMRAVFASLLNLSILQVPHFILYEEHTVNAIIWFLRQFEYELEGWWFLSKEELQKATSFDGYLDTIVPSKNFPELRHAVVVDLKGNVVHDPHPNKAWQDLNVYDELKEDEIEFIIVSKGG